MGKRCVAAGCSSTCKDGVHLYGFPKDPELRKKWVDQVNKWEPTAHSYLCSKHFEEDCFQPYSKLAESLGVGKVRVLLKTDAIPTIFERPSEKRKISSSEPASKRRRTAVEKRERSRVSTHITVVHYW